MWNGIANCNVQTNTTERLVAYVDVCSKFVYEIIMFVVTNIHEWQYTPNMLYVFIKHQRGVSYGNYCWDIILGPCHVINTLRQRHDERHFKDAILKWHGKIPIAHTDFRGKITLKFCPELNSITIMNINSGTIQKQFDHFEMKSL